MNKKWRLGKWITFWKSSPTSQSNHHDCCQNHHTLLLLSYFRCGTNPSWNHCEFPHTDQPALLWLLHHYVYSILQSTLRSKSLLRSGSACGCVVSYDPVSGQDEILSPNHTRTQCYMLYHTACTHFFQRPITLVHVQGTVERMHSFAFLFKWDAYIYLLSQKQDSEVVPKIGYGLPSKKSVRTCAIGHFYYFSFVNKLFQLIYVAVSVGFLWCPFSDVFYPRLRLSSVWMCVSF